MPGLRKVSASSVNAIDLEDVKLHCHITHDFDDSDLQVKIDAAVEYCEEETDRTFANTEYNFYLNNWLRSIPIPKSPILSVNSITYVDADGNTQSFTDYFLDVVSQPARILIPSSVSLPALATEQPNVITINFNAGYEDEYGACDLPSQIKQAIYLLVGHWYINRETVLVGTISKDIELGVESLLAKHVVNNNWYWEIIRCA